MNKRAGHAQGCGMHDLPVWRRECRPRSQLRDSRLGRRISCPSFSQMRSRVAPHVPRGVNLATPEHKCSSEHHSEPQTTGRMATCCVEKRVWTGVRVLLHVCASQRFQDSHLPRYEHRSRDTSVFCDNWTNAGNATEEVCWNVRGFRTRVTCAVHADAVQG